MSHRMGTPNKNILTASLKKFQASTPDSLAFRAASDYSLKPLILRTGWKRMF